MKKIALTNNIPLWVVMFFLFHSVFTTNGVLAQNQKLHPYLFFPKAKIDVLKERIKTDTFINNNWNSILKEADGLVNKGDARAKIDYLAIAYLVTNERKYADRIKDVLLKLCSQPTWSNPEMLQRNPPWTSDLQTADRCWSVAIGIKMLNI